MLGTVLFDILIQIQVISLVFYVMKRTFGLDVETLVRPWSRDSDPSMFLGILVAETLACVVVFEHSLSLLVVLGVSDRLLKARLRSEDSSVPSCDSLFWPKFFNETGCVSTWTEAVGFTDGAAGGSWAASRRSLLLGWRRLQ